MAALGDVSKNTGVPVLLEVAGRPAVVIGDGGEAFRVATTLLDAGAVVTVVAPGASETLSTWGIIDRATAIDRAYVRGDLAGAFIAVCFDAGEAARAVSAEAEFIGCLLFVAGRPDLSTFRFADGFVPAIPAEERP